MSLLGKQPAGRNAARSLVAIAVLAGALVTGCASTSDEANTAGDASAVPGNLPGINKSTQGDISVSGVSIVRTGNQLAINAKISNGGKTSDQLQSISSQVTSTLTFSPALTIPAAGSVSLGSGGSKTVLTVNARLEPGGTVALVLNFRDAGSVNAYSSFQ